MKMKILLASVLAMLSVPSSASNFYALWELGKSTYELDLDEENEIFEFNEKGTLIAMGLGYTLNNYIAIEFAHRDLGDVTNIIRDGDNLNYSEFRKTHDITSNQLSLVGTFPLNDQFSIYGRLGYAELKQKSAFSSEVVTNGRLEISDGYFGHNSDQKSLVGFGLNYSIAPNMTLRGEYTRYAQWKDLSLSSFAIGLTYQL